MNVKNLSEACAILAKHEPSSHAYPGINQIMFDISPKNFSKEDIVKLDTLGVISEIKYNWFYCFT